MDSQVTVQDVVKNGKAIAIVPDSFIGHVAAVLDVYYRLTPQEQNYFYETVTANRKHDEKERKKALRKAMKQ